MDYQIVFAPECNIDLTAFLSAWNDDPECQAIARVTRLDQPPVGFPIEPVTALTFLGGVAGTIAVEVIGNLISKLLEQKLFTKTPQSPTVTVIAQSPGTQIIVVKGPE